MNDQIPDSALAGMKMIIAHRDELMKMIRRIIQFASPEEGQKWRISFNIDEETYEKWKELAGE